MGYKTKNGGQAFPVHSPAIDYGMTLRQWYAGQALQGLVSSGEYRYVSCYEELASDAFRIADAMIAHEEAENHGE
jgi:hypothetical protein